MADIDGRNGLRTRVFEGDGRFALDVEKIGWFGIDAGASTITVPPHPYGAWLEGTIWGLPVALLVLARGGLFFHASAIEIDGRAVLLTAPSRHGKTTLAGALAARGHRLLAEDMVRCDVGPPTMVYPGPAMLRLRRDVAEWLVIPGAERVAEDDEKVHLALDRDRRGTCDPMPLAGIVLLHQGETVGRTRVEPDETIQDLWSVSLNVPTPAGRAQCFRHITELAEHVPVWKIVRPLDSQSLDAVIEEVAATARAT